MESYSLKVPENRWTDLLLLMDKYGIKDNVLFENGVVKVLIRGLYIALDVDSEAMEKQKDTMVDEYIDTYYDENTSTCVRIDKDDYIEIKELLKYEFDKIVRSIDKEEFLDIIYGSKKKYDSVFFRDLILDNFDVREYFEKNANVGFSKAGEVIFNGNVVTSLTDNIDTYHSEKSSYEENATLINSIAELTGAHIGKYSRDIVLSNRCTHVVIYDSYDIALSNYVVNDNVKKRMNVIGNKDRVYIADLYDKLSEESKTKLAEERNEENYGPTTKMFYQFCLRYAYDENNFKENKDEFDRILGNLVRAHKYVIK